MATMMPPPSDNQDEAPTAEQDQPLSLTDILPPACPRGYTREQVEQITAEQHDEFVDWSRGMTVALCDGRVWDYDFGEYAPTSCASTPHGPVVYPWDLAQFVRGGEPLD